ncbi:secondary thiamine-phosphate synthase enzyme YjbQ [Acetobacterium carbinolicum]|jgi:secondary thiamine-phosphate synthase enzyme|uniref:secondary thiamine-phosphate synthase enzyme YjbQ n=1 Tax=Acetobacterium TaxID=33951 RepID=UPI002ACAFFB9|nr:secondary thiamine-phosphate synthase enzyme YjbQ [Acetobacterium sp. K1/6]MDZ5725357.1 secondary thiamine-phosphate synthase enzyme YjbQ [Acetobacterium sp. K1/6]
MKANKIEITSSEQLIDITASVREYVNGSRLKNGFVHIQIPERTASVIISINDDWRLQREFFDKLNHLMPKYDGMKFTGWTTACVKATIFGPSLQVMVHDGTLILDKNQSIYFVEFQGPGERQYFISSSGTTLAENEEATMPEELALIFEKRKAHEAEQEQIKEEMRNEWRLREENRLKLEAENNEKTAENNHLKQDE